MIILVEYPEGERASAVGYPVPESTLVLQEIPLGPEACFGDVVECDFSGAEPHRVLRVIGGPRRPTIHVQLAQLDHAGRERWMDARDQESWNTRQSETEPSVILVVAERDGMELSALQRAGGVILR